MLRFVLKRLGTIIPVLLLVSLGTFFLVELVPGDPVLQVVGDSAPADEYQRVRDELGLDDPLLVRYADWLGGVVSSGDLGETVVPPVRPVSEAVIRALPVNIELAALALVLALSTSIPLAMLSAIKPGGPVDRAISGTMFGLISVPSFLMALLLVLVFGVTLGWFPVGQWVRVSEGGLLQNLKHATLPAVALALVEIPVFTRVLRNDLVASANEDYVMAARARGMPTRHILVKEMFRPSSLSLLTVAGLTLGRLLGGTVVIEAVFALPGLGSTIVAAAKQSNYPTVQAATLIIAVIYVVLNLVIDVAYAVIDPRVGHDRG